MLKLYFILCIFIPFSSTYIINLDIINAHAIIHITHNKTKEVLMLTYIFTQNPSELQHVSMYLDHLQEFT
jgi:hypothetical protein